MDNNGTLFSSIIALGVGMVLIGLLIGAFLIVAGAVMVVWAAFTILYWINAALEWRKARTRRAL